MMQVAQDGSTFARVSFWQHSPTKTVTAAALGEAKIRSPLHAKTQVRRQGSSASCTECANKANTSPATFLQIKNQLLHEGIARRIKLRNIQGTGSQQARNGLHSAEGRPSFGNMGTWPALAPQSRGPTFSPVASLVCSVSGRGT